MRCHTKCLAQWYGGQDIIGAAGKHLLDLLVSLSHGVREETEPRKGKEPAQGHGLPHFLMRTEKKNRTKRSSQGQELGAGSCLSHQWQSS